MKYEELLSKARLQRRSENKDQAYSYFKAKIIKLDGCGSLPIGYEPAILELCDALQY